MPSATEQFRQAREAWLNSALAHVQAREDYRKAYAQALLSAEGKTVDAKKAEADLATSKLRLRRDETEVYAESELHALLYWRGAHTGSELPIVIPDVAGAQVTIA